MAKRKFRIVQRENNIPVLGVCECCNAESLDTVYVVVNYRSESPVLLSKSGAASFVMKTLGIGGPLSWASRVLPDGLLNFGYDLIARNRYRVFGKSETCIMPRAEFKKRFIDI